MLDVDELVKKSAGAFPFMVLYITMNGKTETCRYRKPFALIYKRANGTFNEVINVECTM